MRRAGVCWVFVLLFFAFEGSFAGVATSTQAQNEHAQSGAGNGVLQLEKLFRLASKSTNKSASWVLEALHHNNNTDNAMRQLTHDLESMDLSSFIQGLQKLHIEAPKQRNRESEQPLKRCSTAWHFVLESGVINATGALPNNFEHDDLVLTSGQASTLELQSPLFSTLLRVFCPLRVVADGKTTILTDVLMLAESAPRNGTVLKLASTSWGSQQHAVASKEDAEFLDKLDRNLEKQLLNATRDGKLTPMDYFNALVNSNQLPEHSQGESMRLRAIAGYPPTLRQAFQTVAALPRSAPIIASIGSEPIGAGLVSLLQLSGGKGKDAEADAEADGVLAGHEKLSVPGFTLEKWATSPASSIALIGCCATLILLIFGNDANALQATARSTIFKATMGVAAVTLLMSLVSIFYMLKVDIRNHSPGKSLKEYETSNPFQFLFALRGSSGSGNGMFSQPTKTVVMMLAFMSAMFVLHATEDQIAEQNQIEKGLCADNVPSNCPKRAYLGIGGFVMLALVLMLSFYEMYGIGFRIRNDAFWDLVRPLYLNFLLLFVFSCIYFTIGDEIGGIKRFSDAVYFAVITHTTIGYGDYYPLSYRAKLAQMLHTLAAFFLFTANVGGGFLFADDSAHAMSLTKADWDVIKPTLKFLVREGKMDSARLLHVVTDGREFDEVRKQGVSLSKTQSFADRVRRMGGIKKLFPFMDGEKQLKEIFTKTN